MDTVDPAAEWRRLEELYRQMSEDELQVVADEAYDLTEIAREVLQREIGTRGVDITLREEPAPPPEPEPDPETEGFDPAELDLIVVIAFGTQSKQDTTSRSSIMRECRRISVRTISRTLMITPAVMSAVSS